MGGLGWILGLRDLGEVGQRVVVDVRMADAATALGLTVLAPA